jgi:hypothetical protein
MSRPDARLVAGFVNLMTRGINLTLHRSAIGEAALWVYLATHRGALPRDRWPSAEEHCAELREVILSQEEAAARVEAKTKAEGLS